MARPQSSSPLPWGERGDKRVPSTVALERVCRGEAHAARGLCAGRALSGRGKDRPELVEPALELEARLSVLPARGGEGFLRRLFEPLGYEVPARRHPLDEKFPAWGESPYHRVSLRATRSLHELL